MNYSYKFSPTFLQITLGAGEPLANIPLIYAEIIKARPQLGRIGLDITISTTTATRPQAVPHCWYCGDNDRLTVWRTQAVNWLGEPVGELTEERMCHRHSVQVRASIALRSAGLDELANTLDDVVGIETRRDHRLWA